jgi:regulator of sirC expression with transglutaminase-like and TPR domain
MLRNLREVYRQQGQFQKLKKVLDRILILDPDDDEEKRLRASLGA